MLGLCLEEEPDTPILVDNKKPENRCPVPPMKKPNMSVMECIMERREHLTRNKYSLFVSSVDGNFESDEGGVRQRVMNNYQLKMKVLSILFLVLVYFVIPEESLFPSVLL